MNSFNDLFKTACNIKSTHLNQDKKKFNNLPEFYQSGLYHFEITNTIRLQNNFKLKKFSFDLLKNSGLEQLKQNNPEEAHYIFTKALAIFKYIKCSNSNWKKEGGIKDEELTYYEDEGNNKDEKEEIKIYDYFIFIKLCSL